MQLNTQLPNGYRFVELSAEEFEQLVWQEWAPKIFDGNHTSLDFRKVLSEDELLHTRNLYKNLAGLYSFNLCIFKGDEFCGWFFGQQQNNHTFYMQNSAILPQFRKQGLYTALLHEVLNKIKNKGFQIVLSRHIATNNSIIIPKLKAGFVITGLELSDRFGTLVHLSYFFNETRRKVMSFRAGELQPDQKLKNALGIK